MPTFAAVCDSKSQIDLIIKALINTYDCPTMELGIYKNCGSNTCEECLRKSARFVDRSTPLVVYPIEKGGHA